VTSRLSLGNLQGFFEIDALHDFRVRQFTPGVLVREHFPQQCMVESMARFVRVQVTKDRRFREGQVTDAVEDLVTRKFVIETQTVFIDDLVLVYQNRVTHRTAERQSLGAKLLELIGKTKGARRCNFIFKHVVDQVDRQALGTDCGAVKLDFHGNPGHAAGFQDGEAFTLPDLDATLDPDTETRYALGDNPGLLDDFDNRRTATIGAQLPSSIGTSSALISIIMLSTPQLRIAASRCSTVPMVTPCSLPRTVHRRVSTTFFHDA